MTSTDYLWIVYRALPVTFFLDLAVLPFALWWRERWRKARRGGAVAGVAGRGR